ncbi:hypothetical protein [Halobellus rufus]|uniref:hypothetical protein n=1 Tax=Halobellus rufus TaxID=1448860 RepID=UPI0006786624|nr:hypothetical protein [Halobellus rufus]
MPLQTQHYDLEDEVQRLEQKRRDLAAEARDLDADDPRRGEIAQENNDIETWLDGLEGVLDPPEESTVPQFEAVTLAGLAGGEYGHVEDTLVDAALTRGDDSVGKGAERVHLVAKGTVDAPYLDDEMGHERQVAVTGSRLPLGYLKWAENRIEEMSSVGNGERESFESLVAASSETEPSEPAAEN